MSADAVDPIDVVGFEATIRPLFRDVDRDAMESWFDLWDYEDVRSNSHAILHRVERGTMPCDAPWPPDHTVVFRSWIDGGFIR